MQVRASLNTLTSLFPLSFPAVKWLTAQSILDQTLFFDHYVAARALMQKPESKKKDRETTQHDSCNASCECI
jgi:hypothetical protein